MLVDAVLPRNLRCFGLFGGPKSSLEELEWISRIIYICIYIYIYSYICPCIPKEEVKFNPHASSAPGLN